ncbi:hypothetical protein AVEN_119338-1 [Araneus ventricosus]|uniref:Uncharacterized protein n=1 Tax=Araneus ventricosus TaxID=182803 RepID=A0A4Y2T042_ARAVE|nr:hypothetical protein AVEN_119338-1 [Araneus ventricosus]
MGMTPAIKERRSSDALSLCTEHPVLSPPSPLVSRIIPSLSSSFSYRMVGCSGFGGKVPVFDFCFVSEYNCSACTSFSLFGVIAFTSTPIDRPPDSQPEGEFGLKFDIDPRFWW